MTYMGFHPIEYNHTCNYISKRKDIDGDIENYCSNFETCSYKRIYQDLDENLIYICTRED